ncbi:MAG: tRNA epoxyqueuosine(34) reductase QueG [Proteobacteria bacterium]|nr:tRNA epoxyqueuosine(34) reductase QueG [Pseudomonadota bacterium]
MIKAQAVRWGFDAVGIARLADFGVLPGERLLQFIGAGHHGDMAWLEERAMLRRHPNSLWPEARSAIVVGLNYGPDIDPLSQLDQVADGAISVYAQGRDYHDVLKGRLKSLAGDVSRLCSSADLKVFVDTAPVMEKPLAALAGIGWQGRHTNLVSRQLGSWLFLGVILTTADLAPDRPAGDSCGSCRACLDICPTQAFPEPYQLDARRCISYLTIEHKGPIPRALRPLMGNRIYGCDDCLAVCPWNKFASLAREARLHGTAATRNPGLRELLDLDDPAFRQRFSGSPIKRTGRDRFIRNVLVAAGNSGLTDLADAVEALLSDASSLVRGSAVWALARLRTKDDTARLAASHLSAERDPYVRSEWEAELAHEQHR